MNTVRFFGHSATLAIALAATSAPAFAQEAAIAPPPVVTTQPAAAPVAPPPVVSTLPGPNDRVAPSAQASVAADKPAPVAKKAVAAAKPVAKIAPRAVAAAPSPTPVNEPVAATDSGATTLTVDTNTDIIVPAADADIIAAPAVEETAPVATAPTNDFGASENDWLYWVGGLAGLLGLAGAGAALTSRRSRRHANEHFADEGHVIVESHEAPSFAARPAFAAAPSADAQFAPPASSGFASGSRSATGAWTPGYFESMVEDGPSEVNPFLTRKNRLRRARFLDRQAANQEPIYDWRGKREILFASQAPAEPELVH